MKLLNTAGLWLLIGIPVLILIYLIRSRLEERSVSSTYLWRLSERFMKKRIPLQKMRKILAFLAQVLMIAALAFIAAEPVIMEGDAVHYIVILDASATMQTMNADGESRFERAVREAEELAGETENGHMISLILASDTSSCVLSQSDSASVVKRTLSALTCSNGTADIDGALQIAQNLQVSNVRQQVMIFTDQDCSDNENITVINMADGEWNVSVTSLTCTKKNRESEFTGTITDTRTETLTVGLKIDGKLTDAVKVDFSAGEQTPVAFILEDTDFDTAEIYVDVEDGLASDNSYACCFSGEVSAGVLICSEYPKYLENVFSALNNCTVTVVSAVDEADLSGYDLYVFDGMVPETVPEDGSVLYIHTDLLPDGLAVREEKSSLSKLMLPQGAAGEFYEDLTIQDTYVSEYDSLSLSDSWQTLLLCGDDPVMAARQLSGGRKEMVLSFDLHDSNLPLQSSFVVLIRNLVTYSVPQILTDNDYVVGETLNLAVLPGADSLYVKAPDGSAEEVIASGLYGVYVPEQTGIHTAVEKTAQGGRYMDFFVHLPESELKAGGELSSLSYQQEETGETKESAMKRLIFWIALAALILVLGEWGLYYYEQY